MPTYDYECMKCGHAFEVFHSMSAEPKKHGPQCRGKVQRLISGGAGLLFKGTGFYTTDYRSEGYKSAAKADKPATASKSDGKAKKKATKSTES